MVSSVDGEVSVCGKAGGIGGAADRRVMRTLRSKVDAVMIGAGTLRAERLNLGLDDHESPQPLAVIVGGSGELPLGSNLVVKNQRVLVALPGIEAEKSLDLGDAEILHARSRPEGGDLDLARLLGQLKNRYGVERLLVEGGPSLNRRLIEEGLVDELFLTVSPSLLASGAPAIVSDEPSSSKWRLNLVSAHEADDHLFLRYRLP